MEVIHNKKGQLKKALFPVGIAIAAGWIILIAGLQINARKTFFDIARANAENAFVTFDERSAGIRDVIQYGKTTNEVLISNLASAYSGVDFTDPSGNVYSIYAKSNELQQLVADSDIDAIHIVSEQGKVCLTTNLSRISAGDSIMDAGLLTQEQFELLKQKAGQTQQDPLVVETEEGHKELYCAAAMAGSKDPSADAGSNYVIMECAGVMEESARAMLSDLSPFFAVDAPELGLTKIMVDLDTGIIRFGSHDAAGLLGEKAADHGIDLNAVMEEDGGKTLTVDGRKYPSYTTVYHSDELGSYALIYRYYGVRRGYTFLLIAVMLLITVAVLTVTVCGVVMEEPVQKTATRKLIGMILLGEVLVAGAAFYFAAVSQTSATMKYAPRVVDSFVDGTVKNAEAGERVNEFYQRRVISIARTAKSFLERRESYAFSSGSGDFRQYLVTDETGNTSTVPDVFGHPTVSLPHSGVLEGLCYLGAYDDIRILDSNGRTIAASGPDWHYDVISGQHATDAEVMKVLHREKDYYYEMEEYSDGTRPGATIAVPMDLYISDDREGGRTVYHSRDEYEQDTTGTISRNYGVLLIRGKFSGSLALGFKISANTSLSAVEAAMGVNALLISSEAPHACLDYHGLTEAEVAAIGFTDEDYMYDTCRFTDSVYGRVFAMLLRLGDQEEPADLKETRSARLLLLTDRAQMFRDVPKTALVFIGLSAVLFAVAFLIIQKQRKAEQRQPGENRETGMIQAMEGRRIEPGAGAVIRREYGPAALLLQIILYAAALALLVFRIKSGNGAEGDFFSYMIGKQWPKGLNFFSVSYVLYLSVLILAVLKAAGKLVELVSSSMNPAFETVMRLILSIINYAGILILLFYSLQMLGVQTGTVITFGGIITGVIGLGANSLISDIIAGLFIIFEREFRVNDIVTIDGFTGVVRGIGLRTTRVQDAVGNVKTFNNSKINGVLNLTENYSTAFASMAVSLEVPVAVVEALVDTELPKRMADCTDIVEGPWFSGILDVKGGFYTISVGARCEQRRVWSVKKEVTKHLLELLRENGIKIA